MTKMLILLFVYLKFIEGGRWFGSFGYILNTLDIDREFESFSVSIVFTTIRHNGVLLYAVGPGRAYFIVELYHGTIRFSFESNGNKILAYHDSYVGRGLANNRAHQIELFVSPNDVTLVVDRGSYDEDAVFLPKSITKSIIINKIFVGGHPLVEYISDKRSLARAHFQGCIDHAIFSDIDLLQSQIYINVENRCHLITHYPITFKNEDSYFMVNRAPYKQGLNISFDFITYVNSTTIIYEKIESNVLNISLQSGYLSVAMYVDSLKVTELFHPMPYLNNASWHKINVRIPGRYDTNDRLELSVDNIPTFTKSSVWYDGALKIKIGGYGFIGCLENIMVDNIYFHAYTFVEQQNILHDSCVIFDYCTPNPCLHGGYCTQNTLNYSCICLHTGYTGVDCETPLYEQSCSNLKVKGLNFYGNITLDLDGVGHWPLVYLTCENMNSFTSELAQTIVNSHFISTVDSKNSYTFKFNYGGLTDEQLMQLVMISDQCYQTVRYVCQTSALNLNNETLIQWEGPNKNVHYYWNSEGVNGMCECGLNKKCSKSLAKCNCDSRDNIRKFDETTLRYKDHLPLVSMTVLDKPYGSYVSVEASKLVCSGFGGRNYAVTFQERFSNLALPPWDSAEQGVLYMEIRTDTSNYALVAFSIGRINYDYFRMEITNEHTMVVNLNFGGSDYVLQVNIANTFRTFDDNEFHFISFNYSRYRAVFTVNDISTSVLLPLSSYDGKIRLNLDNSPFYIGGSPYEQFNGFKGTIRSLFMNGKLLDLPKYAGYGKLQSMGVYPGFYSSCTLVDNPCNLGICKERYNYYVCNCTVSPFYGINCEEDRGVIFTDSLSALYLDLPPNMVIEEGIYTVGFTTTCINCVLMTIIETITNTFLMIAVVDGKVKTILNFQSGSKTIQDTLELPDESNVRVSDNRRHWVRVWHNYRTLTMTVDGVNITRHMSISESVSPNFVNPTKFYVGDTVSFNIYGTLPSKRFVGCITGAKALIRENGKLFNEAKLFDPIYENIDKALRQSVTRQSCGLNFNIPLPLPLLQSPPNPVSGGEGRRAARLPLNNNSTALFICIAILLFTAIFLGAILFLRKISRSIGVYKTDEGTDALINRLDVTIKRTETNATALPSHINKAKNTDSFFL
uniref:Neurexin 4-like n=1 Tax=Tetracapsuloides bryosalmonae TaxID=271932 RepID=A0A859IQL0_9CNID|nr:neurexin 4-like [Tetracapsuloides bryosalmonae]